MKIKYYLFTLLMIFSYSFYSYSAIQQMPNINAIDNMTHNVWYYGQEVDKFNDYSGGTLILSVNDGVFNNSVAVNEYCEFLIALKSYSDSKSQFFMISMLEYGLLSFEDYTGMMKVSLKYNDEVYEYPSVLLVDHKRVNFVTIDEKDNSELFHIILYLLLSQTPFKLRLEKYSSIGVNYNNSYICELPATNFSEVYNAIYINANN